MKKKPSKPGAAPWVRAHAYFTGRVQGVGFRYTAERIALDLGLTGWVRNLPDGRVEIVCEGERPVVESLFEKIRTSHLGPHIKKTVLDWETATSEFDDFRVEFCY
jgi:acylphosphatase